MKLGLQGHPGTIRRLRQPLLHAEDAILAGGSEAGILDAYVTYKTGDFTITGGKYLSYLGYEASIRST